MKLKIKYLKKRKVQISDLQTKQIGLFKANVEASKFLNIGESSLSAKIEKF